MKILHVYSGGLDSTVLLYKLISEKNEVSTIGFTYGGKHNRKESESALKICRRLWVERTTIHLNFMAGFDSALTNTNEEIPTGHYQAENMRRTVVPFRNGIMLSISAGVAESKGYDAITIGAHAGDHYIYPDCRPQFLDPMEDAIREGTEKRIRLIAPFYNMDKTEIIRLGVDLNVPFEDTWTCYNGGDLHCGVCGSCDERKKSFIAAGVADPTRYVA
jgi:7-cyano-7-deazaguanine synthase